MRRQPLTGKPGKSSALGRQGAKQPRVNGALSSGPPVKPSSQGPQGVVGKAQTKDTAGSRHKQEARAGKEGSRPKPAGQAARQGTLSGRAGGTKGWPKGSPKQLAKAKPGMGNLTGPSSGQPSKYAAQGKRDMPPKAPQQRPPTVTLEPTDLFL